MINQNRLHGEIIANGYTIKTFAQAMNMSRSAFYRRLKAGVFSSDEIQEMLELLHVENPVPIFFASKVTRDVT